MQQQILLLLYQDWSTLNARRLHSTNDDVFWGRNECDTEVSRRSLSRCCKDLKWWLLHAIRVSSTYWFFCDDECKSSSVCRPVEKSWLLAIFEFWRNQRAVRLDSIGEPNEIEPHCIRFLFTCNPVLIIGPAYFSLLCAISKCAFVSNTSNIYWYRVRVYGYSVLYVRWTVCIRRTNKIISKPSSTINNIQIMNQQNHM